MEINVFSCHTEKEGSILLDFVEKDYKYGSPLSRLENGPETIIIPYGAERIGNEVFENCTWLKQVIIPDTVKRIGNGAFAGSGLIDCYVPEGVCMIEGGAFFNSNLKSVFLPQTLKVLKTPFVGCINLSEMYIASNDITFLPTSPNSHYKDDLNIWGFDTNRCSIKVPMRVADVYKAHWAFKNFGEIVPIRGDLQIVYMDYLNSKDCCDYF